MTDPLITESDSSDGGEIVYENGLVKIDDGLESACYLSLFGGNQEDSGDQSDESKQWWGNLIEEDESAIMRSRFQYLADNLPTTTSNLALIREGAEADLAWMASTGVVDSTEVSISVPKKNRIAVSVVQVVSGERFTSHFERNWNQ